MCREEEYTPALTGWQLQQSSLKTTTESVFICEHIQGVEKISGCNKVTSVLIPEHHGIPGNEEADKLTKEENNKVPVDQTTDIPFAVGKEVIKNY